MGSGLLLWCFGLSDASTSSKLKEEKTQRLVTNGAFPPEGEGQFSLQRCGTVAVIRTEPYSYSSHAIKPPLENIVQKDINASRDIDVHDDRFDLLQVKITLLFQNS